MFNKALYKQSWKANWIQWLSIVFVSVFVLSIIMLVSSGDGLAGLTTSITEVIVKDNLEAQYQNLAISFHSVSYENLETFDTTFANTIVDQVDELKIAGELENLNSHLQDFTQNAYEAATYAYMQKVDAYIVDLDESYTSDSDEYEQLLGAAMFSLNPGGQFNDMYESFEEGSAPADYDILTLISKVMGSFVDYHFSDEYLTYISSPERTKYRNERAQYGSKMLLAGSLSTSEQLETIEETLKEYKITMETYFGFGFDYEGLKKLSMDAVITYRHRLDYELSLINEADYESNELYLAAVKEKKIALQKDITLTVLDNLPLTLKNAMEDMQDYDVYTMAVGNIYFKIVGLLLGIVYVIITGVNLIAGQVDSGSMVYTLSSGTKRNTVTFTQMVFFVSSTFFLYVAMSIASTLLFYFSPPVFTPVTMAKLLLFNAGAFLSTMTLGGIIFLASCIFNRYKHAVAAGGGFAVLTLVATILGLFGSDAIPSMMRMESLNFFNYFSLVTLFDVNSIVAGTTTYIWKLAILAAVTIVCFGAGMAIFDKKDLPL